MHSESDYNTVGPKYAYFVLLKIEEFPVRLSRNNKQFLFDKAQMLFKEVTERVNYAGHELDRTRTIQADGEHISHSSA